MKNKIVATLILTMSLIGFSNLNLKDVDALEIGGGISITTPSTSIGVGYSINLAKDGLVDYNSIKFDNPVLDMGWVNQQTLIKNNINEYQTFINHSNSFDGYINELDIDADLASSNYQDYPLLLGSALSKFGALSDVTYSEHAYQYYSTYDYIYKKHSYALPNYQTDLYNYKRYLSDSYYNDVESLLYDELSSSTFFERYGTHVIAEGVFGGKIEINYGMSSFCYDIWDEYYDSITNYLYDNLYSKVRNNTTINFDLFNNFSFYYARASEDLSISTVGGTISVTPDISNLCTVYSDWISTVSDKPFIIGVTNNGLIPLWDILPLPYDNTEYREIFINKYNEYMSTVEQEAHNQFDPAILNDPTGVATGFEPVRSGMATITDSGIYNQYYDVIYLNQHFDLKFNYMKAKGFTKMDIYVEMKMREIKGGTQIIALYRGELPSDSYLIDTFEYEYGGILTDNAYGSTIGFARFNVPMSLFESVPPSQRYKVAVRYSADGALSDDWENKSIYAQIVYHK